ncbi:hypothetical protein CKM354_000753000 [Cercospora kikuchii]|uniref:Uncharacterized protein n=1 Tax=Cercospora kikuchii TaxID=84275 RepID=A0A9P3CK58_9PEZI|nr:uncharacterized protein CKM354_000753000 [Cercospora kikuchii]GIZ44329.1 hypothetical protein CKM354_000753000 [Cercospora kikuchii]
MAGHPFDLELGQLDLVSTTSGLRLQLTSKAQVAASAHDLEMLSAFVTTSGSLQPKRPWLTLTHGFRLTIRLRFPPCDRGEEERLTEQLSQRLLDDNLWRQLQLEPKAREISRDSAEYCMQIRIVLDDHERTEHDLRCNAHKLAQNVPARDIQPPPGVPKAELREATLSLEFTAPETCKRRKTRASPDHNMIKAESSDEVLLDPAHHQSLGPGSYPQDVHSIRRTRTTPERGDSCADMWSATEKNVPEDEVQSADTQLLRPGLKRCWSTGDMVPNMSDRIAALPLLFDAGLRYSIAVHLKCSTPDIVVIAIESLKHLADVCPTGFSPGFLGAVASRAAFMPTVSHALSNVCAVNARSQTLRNKLEEIARRDGLTTRQQSNMSTMQDSLGNHMWTVLTANLQESDRASRVRSMMNCEQSSTPFEMLTLDGSAFRTLGPDEPEAWPEEAHCCCGEDDCVCLPDLDLDHMLDEGWDEFSVDDVPSASEEDSRAESHDQISQARDTRVANLDDEVFFGSEQSQMLEKDSFLGVVPGVVSVGPVCKDNGMLVELDFDAEEMLAI